MTVTLMTGSLKPEDTPNATFPGTLAELRLAMDNCLQSAGLSVYQHGELVSDFFDDLVAHLRDGTDLRHPWRLPAWVSSNLLDHLLPLDVLRTYQVWHDCGKPGVVTVGEDGRRHFPGHAQASERAWLACGGDPSLSPGQNAQAARLMGMDMDIHLLKGDQVAEFASRPEAVSLLLTGLAEVHANASMFGGIQSDSFKIKCKHIERRGKQVLSEISENRKRLHL